MIWVSGAIGVGGSLDKVLELSSANGSAADPGLDYCNVSSCKISIFGQWKVEMMSEKTSLPPATNCIRKTLTECMIKE